MGGKSSYKPAGTDFSTTKTTEDWEEVRLKKQLSELEAKIEKVEAASANRSGGRRDTKPALVKRELEQLDAGSADSLLYGRSRKLYDPGSSQGSHPTNGRRGILSSSQLYSSTTSMNFFPN